MDKINRALLDIDDIRSRQQSMERKLSPIVIEGKKSNGGISFGVIEASHTALVVSFEGGNGTLTFNGVTVGEGISPIVAAVNGTGELVLEGIIVSARALVLGAKVKTGA
ncbi:MAG: hypothetical protein J1F39_02810 [Clostridiales bacterium]|nr:hypothetical protein [Clostridiales bacterium]